MTQLPRAFRRWQQQLQIFPEDVGAILGKLMLRLAPLVENFSGTGAEHGEVDGFDGVERRGHYERLLPTEWLLRDTLPLEFLRRAAGGEHAFFRLARKLPAPTRTTLLLFDAGPDQLGACRLAHLAVLLLLSERASARREALQWQLLHHLGEEPLGTCDEQSVHTFLAARSTLRSTSRSVASWRQRFPEHRLWIVGPHHLMPHDAAGTTGIAISERVAPAVRLLDVTLTRGTGRARELTLELPAADDAVRILRNPFDVQSASRANVALPPIHGNLLLNDAGSRLYYRDERGDLLALTLPNSPRAQPGRARRYSAAPGTSIIAAGGHKRSLWWLCQARGVLVLRHNRFQSSKNSELKAPGPLVDPGEELMPFVGLPPDRATILVAPDRSLWRVNFLDGHLQHLAEGVRALLTGNSKALVAVDRWVETHDALQNAVFELSGGAAATLLLECDPWEGVCLRQVRNRAGGWVLGCVNAGRVQLSAWGHETPPPASVGAIFSRRALHKETLHLPSGATLLGIDADAHHRTMVLLALDGARRELFLVGRQRARTLFRASSEITRVAVANAAPLLAFTTADGELGVVDQQGAVRFRCGLSSL